MESNGVRNSSKTIIFVMLVEFFIGITVLGIGILPQVSTNMSSLLYFTNIAIIAWLSIPFTLGLFWDKYIIPYTQMILRIVGVFVLVSGAAFIFIYGLIQRGHGNISGQLLGIILFGIDIYLPFYSGRIIMKIVRYLGSLHTRQG